MSLNPEFERISYLLDSSNELEFLKNLKPNELKTLRIKIENSIYNEKSEVWGKLAGVSKFMPNFLNAKVAEEILGPSLTANLTYHLPIKEALSVASFFSISFLTKLAEVLIPEKAEKLIAEFPNSKIILIIANLEKEEKFYTMANFVEHLPVEKLKYLAQEIKSEITLLKIASFVSKRERLALIIESFTLEKLKKLLFKAKELNLKDLVIEVLNHSFENEKKIVNSLFEENKELKSFYLEN